MATKSRFDDLDKLVDTEQGFISREIFVDPDLYKEELEKVFTRAWLFIGHESLIPKPGDFFTSRMGEESVILCRDKQGDRARLPEFLPASRHEGVPLRPGQHLALHLPVSQLDLHHRRQAAGRAAVSEPLYEAHWTGMRMVAGRGRRSWRSTRARSGPPGTRTRPTS